jgi:hypothetical protein
MSIQNEYGVWGIWDESGDFSNQIWSLGYDMYAYNIQCEHLEDVKTDVS